VLTADTYTSVLTDLLAYAAEAAARLMLAAAVRNPGRRHGRNGHPAKSAAPGGDRLPGTPAEPRSTDEVGVNR
jgi:hypothetical protein